MQTGARDRQVVDLIDLESLPQAVPSSGSGDSIALDLPVSDSLPQSRFDLTFAWVMLYTSMVTSIVLTVVAVLITLVLAQLASVYGSGYGEGFLLLCFILPCLLLVTGAGLSIRGIIHLKTANTFRHLVIHIVLLGLGLFYAIFVTVYASRAEWTAGWYLAPITAVILVVNTLLWYILYRNRDSQELVRYQSSPCSCCV